MQTRFPRAALLLARDAPCCAPAAPRAAQPPVVRTTPQPRALRRAPSALPRQTTCRVVRGARVTAGGAGSGAPAAAPEPGAALPLVREGEVVRAANGLVAVDNLGQDVPLGVRVAFEGGAEGMLISRTNGYSVVLLWPPTGSAAPPPAPGARATVGRVFAVVSAPDAMLGAPPRTVLADLVQFVAAPPSSKGGEWPPPPLGIMAEIPGVPMRTPITTSLHTGVKAVDILAPLGRGQCMLVVGEPGAGKTALALDTLSSQRAAGVKCVYVALGGGADPAAAVGPHTVVVAAPPSATPGVAFVTLCAGFALAEAWRDAGEDALIIVDDCGFADAFWATCSALIPAPVAQPGATQEEMVEYDGMLVSASAAERRRFFSSFLQRAARLNVDHGGGSLTLLALLSSAPGAYRFGAGALAAAQAELSAARSKLAAYTTLSEEQKRKLLGALEAKTATAAAADAAQAAQAASCPGTVSRPIVEEFMSVSDGQVFLQSAPGQPGGAGARFNGTWVVSPRDSVSRIGLEAAAPALRSAGSSSARLELAQADDADSFAAGAAGVADVAAARLRAALQQRAGAPVPLSQQVAILLALRNGACSAVAPSAVPAALDTLLARLRDQPDAAAAMREVDATATLSKAAQATLLAAL
jgi:F-type H+-transporting ATPase subunit alpha